MSSVLQHYNPYKIDSQLDWQGLRSSKFGRTRLYIPPKDIISHGMTIPNQGSKTHSQRKHLYQAPSPQRQFKPSVKIISDLKHWTPRISSKKVVEFKPTEPLRRAQRMHLHDQIPQTERAAGIRTFYNVKIKDSIAHEYKIEDRMQRKRRSDILEMRRSFYDRSSIL